MTDERARQKLLSDATDTALDFILRILPSMPVPPFDGVKDGLVYHISNLSMEGFKVKKENIVVEVAGMRATKKYIGPQISVVDESFDRESDAGASEKPSENEESADQSTQPHSPSSVESSHSHIIEIETRSKAGSVKATELLIIDVREISAAFNDAVWRFEQTYLPYLKGNGQLDVKMSDGAIRLVFELRRRRKSGESGEEWEPVLCLHDRFCSIGSVELTMQGSSRIAWVVNKVASVFKGLLRDYVVRTILHILTDKSGWCVLSMDHDVNNVLRDYLDFCDS